MAKIGIIGTGRIGSHIAEQLLVSKEIKEIHLANRDEERLEGRLMSLELRAYLSSSSTKIQKLDFNKVNDLDIIVLCIKDDYDPRKLLRQNNLPEWLPCNLRHVGLLNDLPIIKLLCRKKLKNFKGKIVVITNPIEIITFFTAKWLPNATVFGLGASVDSARISYILSNEKKVAINKFSCIVAGEHGNDLIIVSNLWNKEKTLSVLTKKQTEKCLKRAIQMGFEIVNKLGFTLQDCVPVFVDEIKWILGLDELENFHSLAIPNQIACFSRPVKITSENKIIEYKNYTVEESKHLKQVEKRITKLINTINMNLDR